MPQITLNCGIVYFIGCPSISKSIHTVPSDLELTEDRGEEFEERGEEEGCSEG